MLLWLYLIVVIGLVCLALICGILMFSPRSQYPVISVLLSRYGVVFMFLIPAFFAIIMFFYRQV